MEMPVYEGLTIPFNEFFATISNALGNGSGYPRWIMKFYVRVGNQVAILFKVMGYADHLSVSFDHKTVKVGHIETDMEVILCLKALQQVMGFQ